jgi:thiol-disulfide isomerase/thioredoxin
MKRKRSKWIDFLLGVFILLLLIPQTGQPIRVGINRLKVMVWSPRIEADEKQAAIPAFDYGLRNLNQEKVTKRVGDGQITFLSFWATWCAPCVAELPSIEALHEDYKEQINFVLVTHENPEVIQKFLEKKDLNLPVYFPISIPPKALQSNSIPTNFLIDGEGRVLIKETGAANWNSKKVRGLLDGLLNE